MKFNKIFSVLACTALLAAGYACTDKVEPTPSPVAGNEEAYFPYTDPATISIPVNATQISVTVNRVDATEESTVALTSSVSYNAEDGTAVPVTDIFTIPASVTFPKGEKEVTLEIGVNFAKVEIGLNYYLDLKLEDAKTGAYGLGERVFAAIYEPWSEWKVYSESEPGTYTVAVLASGYFKGWVYERQSLINENMSQYSMILPYEDLQIAEDQAQMIFNVDKSRTIEVDGVECPLVWMEGCIDEGVVHSQTGEEVYYSTIYTWLRDYYQGGGKFANDEAIYALMEKNGFSPSYYNPVQGRFYLYMKQFSATYMYGDVIMETMQLPGDFHDYYFTFNHEGNLVSADGDEYALIQIVPSDDIDHFSYNVIPGALKEEAIQKAQEELAGDPDAELIYDATYTVSYPFEEAGTYTVIAVGFDASGKAVCNASDAFDFQTVQAAPEWHKYGTVEYSDGILVGLFLNEMGAATWDVEMEENNETEGLYRLVNPYVSWPLLEEIGWPLVRGRHYLILNCENPNAVYMPICEVGLNINDVNCPAINKPFGAIEVMNRGWYNVATEQKTFEQAFRAGEFGTLKDGIITFPAGNLMVLNEKYDDETGQYIYPANLDPEAPEDAPITWGTGYFMVNLDRANEAPGLKVQHKTNLPSVSQLRKMVKAKAQKASKTVEVKKQLSKEEIIKGRNAVVKPITL